MTSPASRFAAAYAALTASHEVADHWVQIDKQAVAKGQPGPEGARACAAHVATYTATQAAALYAADRLLGLRLDWRSAALGLAVSAATTTSPTGRAATGATPNPTASSASLPPPGMRAGSNATPAPAT